MIKGPFACGVSGNALQALLLPRLALVKQAWCMIFMKFIMLAPGCAPVLPGFPGPHNHQRDERYPQQIHWLKKIL